MKLKNNPKLSNVFKLFMLLSEIIEIKVCMIIAVKSAPSNLTFMLTNLTICRIRSSRLQRAFMHQNTVTQMLKS